MVQELLKDLGFSEKEADVFLCIYERGKASATLISRITKINRTTVYSITKELISKGMIFEDLGNNSRRYFYPLPIEELRTQYKKEERELLKKERVIEQTIEALNSIPKAQHYSVPKLRFVDERQLEDFLYKRLSVWFDSAEKYDDHTMWGFQDPSLLDSFPEWIDFYWENKPEGFDMKMFTNKEPAETAFAKDHHTDRRNVLYWDKTTNFTATQGVIGDYVIYLITDEHPYYLVEIHDSVIAENMRQMYQAMWSEIN